MIVRFYVAPRVEVFASRMKELGISGEVRCCYLLAERRWNASGMKRVLELAWVTSRDEATGFPSVEEAWGAFDRCGAGCREDYTIEPRQVGTSLDESSSGELRRAES